MRKFDKSTFYQKFYEAAAVTIFELCNGDAESYFPISKDEPGESTTSRLETIFRKFFTDFQSPLATHTFPTYQYPPPTFGFPYRPAPDTLFTRYRKPIEPIRAGGPQTEAPPSGRRRRSERRIVAVKADPISNRAGYRKKVHRGGRPPPPAIGRPPPLPDL